MSWFSANWPSVLVVVLAVHTFARRIVELTPSSVDNVVLDKITGFLKVIGIKVGE